MNCQNQPGLQTAKLMRGFCLSLWFTTQDMSNPPPIPQTLFWSVGVENPCQLCYHLPLVKREGSCSHILTRATFALWVGGCGKITPNQIGGGPWAKIGNKATSTKTATMSSRKIHKLLFLARHEQSTTHPSDTVLIGWCWKPMSAMLPPPFGQKGGIMQPHPHQGYFCPPCTTAPWCWHFAHVGFSSPSTKQKLLP